MMTQVQTKVDTQQARVIALEVDTNGEHPTFSPVIASEAKQSQNLQRKASLWDCFVVPPRNDNYYLIKK